MAELRAVPPGRAGRLWLRRRLSTARRGAEILDRKVQVLREGRDRAARLAEETLTGWREAASAADEWLLRAALLGGRRELTLCAAESPAEVSVTWTNVLGVPCPAVVAYRFPPSPPGARSPGSSAVAVATAAVQDAVRAAGAQAAAMATVQALDAELARTRRRLRAVTEDRIPHLEAALRTVTTRLEEADRAEQVRLRWAAR